MSTHRSEGPEPAHATSKPSETRPAGGSPVASELQSRLSQVSMRGGEDHFEMEVEVSGVFVPTLQPQPVGSLVTVRLKLSKDAEALKTLARVTYVASAERAGPRGPGMGLEFLDVWGERATEQIHHYLDEVAGSTLPAPDWACGTTVLVVDDDANYRELAAEVMREAGFDVLTAASGFEALSLALKHQPGLVLTDVTMPNMDGWQLLRLIRARPTLRRTPVVFLTALTNDADRLRGYQLGVDDYVPKPFSQVELTARVERVLERANAADEAVANGMRGDLSKVPVSSLLMLAEMERRSGVLQLISKSDKATLHLRAGAVIRIELRDQHDRLEGMARFFHVLDWREGRFEFSATETFGADEVDTPSSFALLEHARRQDEETGR